MKGSQKEEFVFVSPLVPQRKAKPEDQTPSWQGGRIRSSTVFAFSFGSNAWKCSESGKHAQIP